MNSPKITNVLLFVLVLLLCFHLGLDTFRPVGRYVWVSNGSAPTVLDTSQGTLYVVNSKQGAVLNIVRRANMLRDQKGGQPVQAAPDAPTEGPTDETHRP